MTETRVEPTLPQPRDALLAELRIETAPDGALRVVPGSPHLRIGKLVRERLAASLSSAVDFGLAAQVAEWMRTVLAAKPDMPRGWPSPADIRKSYLLARIRSGKRPLPFPPPTSFSYPWYDIVEQAHRRRAVQVEWPQLPTRWNRPGLRQVVINQCPWTVLEPGNPSHGFKVTFGSWPLTWMLHLETGPRFPSHLPGLEQVADEAWVAMPEGWPIAGALAKHVREHRHDLVDTWYLECVSTRSVRLYVHGEQARFADDRTQEVLQTRDGRPTVIVRGDDTAVTAVWREIAWDPVDQVARFVRIGIPATDPRHRDTLEEWRRGADPLARTRSWLDLVVVEAAYLGGHDHQVLGYWKAPRDVALDLVPDEPVTPAVVPAGAPHGE